MEFDIIEEHSEVPEQTENVRKRTRKEKTWKRRKINVKGMMKKLVLFRK
jgi:hypothetical protein